VKVIRNREKENDDSENCNGNGFWSPDVRLGSDGPARTLTGNWLPGTSDCRTQTPDERMDRALSAAMTRARVIASGGRKAVVNLTGLK
jgi:hypothetical protein